MTFKPKYSFSEEPQPLTERLNPQEQLKFGFTTNVFNSSRNRQNVDFTSMGLPQIDKKNQTLYEKSIRKDRIKSLKNKFGKMLSIKEYEER